MLIPKRVKRRRQHRGRMKGTAQKGNTIAYGEYGLVAEECAWIKSNQIEAARIAMTRFIKRETRMGSGKGSVEYWVAVVKPGRVMFEMAGVPEDVAREAMRLAAHKLPVKCKFVKKEAAVSAENTTEGGEG